MFASIDRENMRLVHLHPEQRVVSDLAHIELSHVSVVILEATSARCWDRFTDLELKLLYRNTCGQELPGYMKADHIKRVMAAVLAAPVADVVAFEVRVQALGVKMDDKRRYRYVKGAHLAALMPDLFEPAAVQVRNPPTVAPAAPPAGPTGPDLTPAAPVAPAAPAAAPSAPRAPGGVAKVVFDAADAAWDAAGQPRQAQAVLKLRKEIMDKLEQQGIKRTTASTTLGAWQKLRLNG